MGKTFRRRPSIRSQYRRFLIVSEGEVTEREYLDAVRRARRIRSASIVFMPPGPTSPVEIVERARDLRNHARRIDPFDDVWCIFDAEAKVDQRARPRLSDAIQMARDNDINVALSNPCIELWILLHEQDQEAAIHSHAAQHLCSKLGLIDKKHISTPDHLLDRYQAARARAEGLDCKHERDGRVCVVDCNPASGIYKLVDSIYLAFPAPG